jgi:hypothetical protein
MSAAGPGRGNGLEAAAYAPVADLEPQLADAMLDALRDEGVAAYVVPAAGLRGAYGDVRLPDRPTDRLWVDRDAQDRVRVVLGELLPRLRAELDAHVRAVDEQRGGSDADIARAWADIVAGYNRPADTVRWPAAEDVPDDVAPPQPAEDSALPAPSTAAELPPPPADDEEHFVPPDPPPLPRADLITRAAWAALLGGPLFFFVATTFGMAPGGTYAFLAVVAFVGGFVTLVARMQDGPRDDSGPDDGAVV